MCPELPKRPSLPFDLGGVKDAITSFRDDIESDYQRITDELDVIEDQFPALMETGVFDQPQGAADDETYGSSAVTNDETMLYQVSHLKDMAEALETHLSEGCKLLNKRCDCCRKHGSKFGNFARETIPIAARSGMDISLYSEMADWADHLEAIPLSVDDKVYQQESGRASIYAKQLRALKEDLKQRVGVADGED